MTRGSGSAMPWEDADVLRLCVTSAIGLIAVATSWYGISGSASTATQALWLNIGVAGVVLAALGNCVWLLRGRRAVGVRRAELVSLAPARPADEPPTAVPPSGKTPDTWTMPLGLVRAEGMRKVHHADCPLVAGKPVHPAAIRDGDPCGVCGP